jgi:hypothetical protein
LDLPQAPHWAFISCVSLSTSASTAASDQLCFVLGRSKGKSTGSDHLLIYKRHYNLVCVLSRSNLDLPPAPHWDTISCFALSTSASTAARDQLCFVLNRSKGNATGLDHLLIYIRYYNVVCVLRRSNLDWPPAPHWATISCLTLSTSASSAAKDR